MLPRHLHRLAVVRSSSRRSPAVVGSRHMHPVAGSQGRRLVAADTLDSPAAAAHMRMVRAGSPIGTVRLWCRSWIGSPLVLFLRQLL
jgi:hypothetical protein